MLYFKTEYTNKILICAMVIFVFVMFMIIWRHISNVPSRGNLHLKQRKIAIKSIDKLFDNNNITKSEITYRMMLTIYSSLRYGLMNGDDNIDINESEINKT